ncbi:MAG: 4-hydroxythreonine-4-phosphate dehydrogenase PdxA [Rhodospirillales bacterium]|nr:4-hydroxythreonine-4-phosphate dehydrogenase PdxA [Rhodospirillales bacterium]
MGDPAGVGPELCLKATAKMASRVRARELDLVTIGTQASIDMARERLIAKGQRRYAPHIDVIEATQSQGKVKFGQTSAEAGRQAFRAIETAIGLAMKGEIDAIATAPISKEAINAAGFHYAGHTEILADLTRSKGSVLMLVHDRLRVSHVSAHVPLAKATSLVTPERLTFVIDLTYDALKRLGFKKPKLGIAAVNPHAGEGGMFGREDIDIVTPVIEKYRAQGMDITGPVPGDTVFVKALGGQFDGVVAMFHDQGHVAVKLLGFKIDRKTGKWVGLSGVNITLGLPIVRTSVDHGTAFDIAGKGIANPQSMMEAIDLAMKLSAARKKTANPQKANTHKERKSA